MSIHTNPISANSHSTRCSPAAPSTALQTLGAAGWQAGPLPGCEANYSALITMVAVTQR